MKCVRPSSVEVPPMDSSKIAFAAHLERKFDTGKCSAHFWEIQTHPPPTRQPLLWACRLPATTLLDCWLDDLACLAGGSNMSPMTSWLERVSSQASAPTRLLWPVRMWNFSPKLGFRSQRLKKVEKTSSEIITFVKNDHPYRSCGISAVNYRSLQ